MPEPENPGRKPGRGDGDDGVVEAWTQLFDALLALDDYGIATDQVLSVLKGYTLGWPL